ncbi:hypothetical protein Q9966_013909 [Columba livia]|nr:hypothetical protein Q9966_013909 [Columba livia]
MLMDSKNFRIPAQVCIWLLSLSVCKKKTITALIQPRRNAMNLNGKKSIFLCLVVSSTALVAEQVIASQRKQRNEESSPTLHCQQLLHSTSLDVQKIRQSDPSGPCNRNQRHVSIYKLKLVLSLGSCAGGRQSSGKLTKESRKEGAGKWKGEDGRAVHEIQFCSPGFYKLAHQQSFISDMLDEQNWERTEQENENVRITLEIGTSSLSIIALTISTDHPLLVDYSICNTRTGSVSLQAVIATYPWVRPGFAPRGTSDAGRRPWSELQHLQPLLAEAKYSTGFMKPGVDIQEFYEVTLLNSQKSYEQKIEEANQVAEKWEKTTSATDHENLQKNQEYGIHRSYHADWGCAQSAAENHEDKSAVSNGSEGSRQRGEHNKEKQTFENYVVDMKTKVLLIPTSRAGSETTSSTCPAADWRCLRVPIDAIMVKSAQQRWCSTAEQNLDAGSH